MVDRLNHSEDPDEDDDDNYGDPFHFICSFLNATDEAEKALSEIIDPVKRAEIWTQLAIAYAAIL